MLRVFLEMNGVLVPASLQEEKKAFLRLGMMATYPRAGCAGTWKGRADGHEDMIMRVLIYYRNTVGQIHCVKAQKVQNLDELER